MIVTKLEAANRQLMTSIRLHLTDDDVCSVHTLVCAAREIYEKHCKDQGIDRFFEMIKSANPERSEKELWTILNGTRNFLKHPEASMDLEAKIEIDDEMNASMIFVACHDCAMLCQEEQPAEVQAFNLWFIGTRVLQYLVQSAGPPDRAGEIVTAIQASYPELSTANATDQKKIGLRMIDEAIRVTRARSVAT